MIQDSDRLKKCVHCGKSFCDKSFGGTGKYCSLECRKAVYNFPASARQKICSICGKEFTDTTRSNCRKYCSAECAEESNRQWHKDYYLLHSTEIRAKINLKRKKGA